MTKQDFVDAVADRAGMSKREAGAAVDAMLDTVTQALKNRLRLLIKIHNRDSTKREEGGQQTLITQFLAVCRRSK